MQLTAQYDADQPLYDNLSDALKFGFNYSGQQYAESMLTKLFKRGIGSGKGLVALDGAAQSGMILSAVERLDDVGQAVIAARFAPRFTECKCCGGDKGTDTWVEAVNCLAAHMVPSGISHMRVRRMLIEKYFGQRGIEFKELGDRFGQDRKAIGEMYRVISKKLQAAEVRAQNTLADEFKLRGLIP
ncbi:MAG: hypothetical protein RBR77_04070 [Thauera sp.]|jgi:hypothetical protein|nr:hypothetical protein [Thauera sp.]